MATPDKIRALANLIEQIEEVTSGCFHALPEHECETVHSQLFEVSQTLHDRLLMYLAYSGDMLVGAEHCDECGEVTGTVVRIDREPELMIVTSRGGFYPRDVLGDEYFRLPGSNAYGELALAELAKARADQAEKTLVCS
jgi:hypothetical protein